MTLYVAFNLDRPNSQEKRLELLPAHRDYMKSLGDIVLWGGPLFENDGVTKCGGMYVFQAKSGEEADLISQNDPFVQGGLYNRREVFPWRWQSGPPKLEKPANV